MSKPMMALVKHGSWFECRARYADRDIVREAGFRWHEKKWVTNNPGVIERLKRILDIKDFVLKEVEVPHVEIPGSWQNHPSNALESDAEIPAPPDKTYYPYQKAGIAFCRGKRNALIADDMGLGKTIQAIGVMNDEPIKTALIICPSGVKVHWQRSLDEWLNYYRSVGIAQGSKIWPDTNIVITNWESAHRQRKYFMRQEWDIVVFDEVHYIKNPDAKRTLAVLGDHEMGTEGVRAKRVLALSGTPVENRPIELWTILRYMMPETFNSWWAYSLCFCGGKMTSWGYDSSGASNLRILGTILRKSIMVRRLKRQVRTQLPPLTREVFFLDAGPDAIRAAEKEKIALEDGRIAARKMMEQATTEEEMIEARIQAAKNLGLMSGARKQVAITKIKPSIALFRDLIDSEKIVVFCYHRQVIDAFAEAFGDAALVIDGRTKDKQGVVDEFVEDESKRILIGQIIAAGTGIDGLQKVCNHVLHVEIDFRPGKVSQAESRVDRGGQRFAVRSTFLVIKDSVDEKLLSDLDDKEEVIDRLMNC